MGDLRFLVRDEVEEVVVDEDGEIKAGGMGVSSAPDIKLTGTVSLARSLSMVFNINSLAE